MQMWGGDVVTVFHFIASVLFWVLHALWIVAKVIAAFVLLWIMCGFISAVLLIYAATRPGIEPE